MVFIRGAANNVILKSMASLLNEEMLADPKQKSFAGRFYPQELINSGGMSEIWLVTDGRNKPYALRKLKKSCGLTCLPAAVFFAAAKCFPR